MVTQAFVSAEDQNFWTHPGVDPLAIARAAVFDLTHMGQGRRPVGASTITQQVAKNMLLDNQVSLSRKAREAILAMRIEQTLPKQRILELYLNEIYMGMSFVWRRRGGAGLFQQAARQADVVRGGVPRRAAEGAEQLQSVQVPRRRQGTARLGAGPDDRGPRHHGAQAAAAAKAEPIIPSEFRRPKPIPGADWFAEEVRRQLIAQFGADVTTQGGLMVRTSLDPALQLVAERAVHDGLMAYDRKMGGWRGPAGHLDGGPALAKNWAEPLGATGATAGHAAGLEARRRVGDHRRRGAAGLARHLRPIAAAAHRHAAAVRDRLGAAGEGRQARAGAAAHDGRDAAGRRGDGRTQRHAAGRSRRRRMPSPRRRRCRA